MMLAFLTTGWLDQQGKVRLHEDQPTEILGYTMTFRGVEKPTPTARDAMVIEITDERGKVLGYRNLSELRRRLKQPRD